MTEWKNYHIHYTDLDSLIVECVYPFLQQLEPRPEKCLFERHFAGGAHLRVRFRAERARVDAVGVALVDRVESFMRSSPSQALTGYSAGRARKLMEIQDEWPESEEALTYRVNVIVERPYQRLRNRLASPQAADLLEDFLGDCMPIIYEVLRAGASKDRELLRLYFLRSLFVAGDLPRGSVSYKAHWEGFAAGFSPRSQVDGIRTGYQHDRGWVRETMLSVKEAFESGSYRQDPMLREWHSILSTYRQRTGELLGAGVRVTRQPTLTEAKEAKSRVLHTMREDSVFLRTLLEDERFIASFASDPNLLWPRVLTNLLYMLVSAAGLNMIGRMRLCHYAFRVVEEHYSCDLTSILETTAQRVIQRNGLSL